MSDRCQSDTGTQDPHCTGSTADCTALTGCTVPTAQLLIAGDSVLPTGRSPKHPAHSTRQLRFGCSAAEGIAIERMTIGRLPEAGLLSTTYSATYGPRSIAYAARLESPSPVATLTAKSSATAADCWYCCNSYRCFAGCLTAAPEPHSTPLRWPRCTAPHHYYRHASTAPRHYYRHASSPNALVELRWYSIHQHCCRVDLRSGCS